jgi:hypothetical protein
MGFMLLEHLFVGVKNHPPPHKHLGHKTKDDGTMVFGALQHSQTANDYWLNYSPAFNAEFGLNAGQGNLTSNPQVNQLLQQANAIESYGIVPTAITISGADPRTVRSFDRTSYSHNPGDLSSTQLSPMGQALFGVSNAPLFPPKTFEPTGYVTAGDLYASPLFGPPAANNAISTGFQSQWFV